MAKKYESQEIFELLKGGEFLSGGISDYNQAVSMLKELESMGYPLEIEILQVEEMREGQCACTISAIGRVFEGNLENLLWALRGSFVQLQAAAEKEEKKLDAVFCNGLGGNDLLMPILFAVFLGGKKEKISLIDVSGNCRRRSGFSGSLPAARNILPSPLAASVVEGNQIRGQKTVCLQDAAAADLYLEELLADHGDYVTFASMLLSKKELEENAGEDYLFYAKRIGEAMGNMAVSVFDAIHAVIPQIKEYYTGTVLRADEEKILIGNEGRSEQVVCFMDKGEFISIGLADKDGNLSETHLTAPEIISMVYEKDRQPFSMEAGGAQRGQKVKVFISPAHHYWWDRVGAYEKYRDKIGKYNGAETENPFVRFSSIFEDNRAVRAMHIKLPYVGDDETLQNNLREYLQQHLYNDRQVYWENLVCCSYTEKEDPEVSEPTVTEEDIVCNGPALLTVSEEGAADAAGVYPWTGHFIGRFGDEKTTRALREAVSRSVFDVFDASVYLTLTIADKIGVITWPQTMVPILERRFAAAGLSERFLWVEAAASPEIRDLKDAADKLIEKGAQAILIGQSFWDKSERLYNQAELLQKEIPAEVPVINANKTGIRWAEMIMHMGYFHSRRSYFTPPVKKIPV